MSIQLQNALRIGRNPYRTNDLTNILHPSRDGHRDLYRAGFRPSWFNQQWGGAQWGNLPDGTNGDIATGQVQDDSINSVGNISSVVYTTTGFKLSESFTPAGVWIKIYKVGNPTDNLQAQVWSDNGSGVPLATLGTLGVLSGKVVTSKTDGEWYFIPVAFPAITAGTQYHIVFSRSTGLDASNYYILKGTGSKKYPHGFQNSGTSTPTWTSWTANSFCFLIPNPVSNQFLQTNGLFDGQYVMNEGTPINQSKSLVNSMRNFSDGRHFTYLTRVTSAQKGKPIAEFIYGLDHDRIQVMTDATTGFARVNFWDKNRNLVTLNATSVDTSLTAMTDIAVCIRTAGDGADYAQLWINGVLQASTINQTYSVDVLMKDLGTHWVGGGFPVAPTWTQDMQMTSLPSAQGWTWAGTATEANAMSVSGGKLYQNKNGYASTDLGNYNRPTAGLNNTTGWTLAVKVRVPSDPNVTSNGTVDIQVSDGTKYFVMTIKEYWMETRVGTTFKYQDDFKTKDRVITMSGKGSDYYIFVDGKLAIDGTGGLTSTIATNSILIGDTDASAGGNSDAIWSYVKYYTGGAILPQASTGMALHEAAYWSGDQTANLANLYSNGVPVSIKRFSGMERNYVEDIQWAEERRGVTSAPTTTGVLLLPELELFAISDKVELFCEEVVNNSSVSSGNTLMCYTDGIYQDYSAYLQTSASANTSLTLSTTSKSATGLHKYDVKHNTGLGTLTSVGTARLLRVKSAK